MRLRVSEEEAVAKRAHTAPRVKVHNKGLLDDLLGPEAGRSDQH